jgi:hypothetical protein
MEGRLQMPIVEDLLRDVRLERYDNGSVAERGLRRIEQEGNEDEVLGESNAKTM